LKTLLSLIFMRPQIAAILALIITPLSAAPQSPNIIFVLADDLGYGELGCYGQKEILTPNLDRMAAEGQRFTRFYSGATVCGPSRSVLLTGRHQGRTTVRGNFPQPESAIGALSEEDVTFAMALKSGGYTNAVFGKWGLGNTGEAAVGHPLRKGFDEFMGYLSHWHAHNHYPDFLWHGEERIELPHKVRPVGNLGGAITEVGRFYADDLFADQGLSFVARHQDRPFMLFWSLVIPHANNERQYETGDGAHVPDYGPYALKDWPAQDKGHAAMITRLDSYMGRLMDQLRLLGIAENTLVFFTSDNGPHAESGHNLGRFTPAGPLTGRKRDLNEGGIRVPGIAWWPGTVRAGSTTDHVAYFGDWFATACDLAGVEIPDGLDSISFAPTLKGRPEDQKEHEFLFWEFHERGYDQAALYQGRWKGIRKGSVKNPLALYDLTNDIAEKSDVAAEHTEIASRIDAYLKSARTESPNWPVK
jgi:arylsulfatase A-like enzyme